MNPNELVLAQTLREIVARAALIGERRSPEFTRADADEKTIHARLDAWLDAVSETHDRTVLEKLWQWDGIDETIARQMVAPVTLHADAALPRWAQILYEAFNNSAPVELPAGVILADEKLPFQEILLPLVNYTQRAYAASPGYALLNPQAQGQLGRALLKTLTNFTAEPLYLDFQALRNRQPFGGLGALVAKASATPKTALYQKFVAQMEQRGLLAFLAKYPVLARILGTYIELNIETRRRFLARLQADVDELGRVFNGGTPPGQVSSLALTLSDLHRGGDSVTAVTFESGLHLVYKPKDLATEVAFNEFLCWINARSNLLELLPLTVLNRGQHGWVTFAEHTACTDDAAVARYYERVGMLLGLMYALEATDCHYENLIAAGEHPVLIDHETLFHHRVPEETNEDLRDSAILRAVEELTNSVMRVGLLPGWTVAKDKRVVYDASGLGGYGGQRVPFQRPHFYHTNTDGMELKLETGILQTNPNIPEVDGKPAQLEDYKAQIVDGFRAMYGFLFANRAELAAPDGPLSAFREAEVRFVFRATQVYASLQRQAQQPAFLRDGSLYSIYLERLARAFLQLDAPPTSYPLLSAERRDLAQLDTPFFTARTDSADLKLAATHNAADGTPAIVHNYFSGPSFELACERIQTLSPRDLEMQTRLIEISLQMRFADEGFTATLRTEGAPPTPPPAIEEMDFVAAAIGLGEELLENMTLGKDGSATWLGPTYMPESGRYQLSITGTSLYDGLPGVGLFAAALANVTGDPKWRDLSYSCFKFVREILKQETEIGIRTIGIGGAAGYGSILYAMTRSGELMNDSALVADAVNSLEYFTPKHIQDDTIHDVIGGAGGAVLALLAVYETTGAPLALKRAQEAAQHLLNTRVPSDVEGYRAWKTIMARPITGFSHGAAGIAYALLRLYQHTGEESLRAAAVEALEFEDHRFDPHVENWHDMRDQVNGIPYNPETPRFGGAWCHGAPGIGLARLGGLPILDNERMRYDIESALHTTAASLGYVTNNADHLCCGNVGRIELLWTAGEKLARPELKQQALQRAAQVVANARTLGGYTYSSFTPRGVFSPGMFVGASGIGYQLLRFGAPKPLPNILLWE